MLSSQMFTHACKHLHALLYFLIFYVAKQFIDLCFIRACVSCNSSDRCEFPTPIEKSENTPPPSPPRLNRRDVWVKPVCSRARVGRAGSVESESCTWQLALGLHLPTKWNPDLHLQPPEPEPPSQCSQHPGWGNTVHEAKHYLKLFSPCFLFPPPSCRFYRSL